MTETCDVAIVGGSVVGSSTAYFLLSQPGFKGRVVVVERDSTYADAATSRSVGGVRQQFSTPENISMSTFGAQFLKKVDEHLGVNGESSGVPLTLNGYLFLASEAGLATLKANHETQSGMGADIVLMSPDELKSRFAWLNTSGLAGGAFGRSNEGWTDPYSLLQAFKRKARSLGAVYVTDEAVGLDREGNRITAVNLARGGRLACGNIVNSAGYRSQFVAQMAGIDLPIRPRKRCVFSFECKTKVEKAPLTIDPTGVYFRPEGAGFIGGVAPPEDNDPDTFDLEPDYNLFEETVWPVLAERIPAFESIKMNRAWAGTYDYNTIDQNAILGPHPEIRNFFFASGFSGHGLQQSPAAGRANAEMIVYGAYRTIDLSRFGYDRFARGKPIIELNVV
jgi:FAD-dependent oxidoreductase domain-containing protein 1